MIDDDAIQYRWDTVGCKLDERGRRMFAACEVRTAGWGGLAIVSRITGLCSATIWMRTARQSGCDEAAERFHDRRWPR